MSGLDIVQIPVLQDNYIYVIRDNDEGMTAVVDPAVAEPVLEFCDEKKWRITHILNTHHHNDHVGGNLAIQKASGCQIVGPRADEGRIPGMDIALGPDEIFYFGTNRIDILDVPGHTSGHIAYWFNRQAALFCGDTLFSLGCGRLFEGTPRQMWNSLQKLLSLPDNTLIFCAHEYTEANGRFALTVEPENADLHARMDEVRQLRGEGKPTVPSTLGMERRTNPFLRPMSPDIQSNVEMLGKDLWRVWRRTRQMKDQFVG